MVVSVRVRVWGECAQEIKAGSTEKGKLEGEDEVDVQGKGAGTCTYCAFGVIEHCVLGRLRQAPSTAKLVRK